MWIFALVGIGTESFLLWYLLYDCQWFSAQSICCAQLTDNVAQPLQIFCYWNSVTTIIYSGSLVQYVELGVRNNASVCIGLVIVDKKLWVVQKREDFLCYLAHVLELLEHRSYWNCSHNDSQPFRSVSRSFSGSELPMNCTNNSQDYV